jgi:nucleoside-diphosphate-sugar epimerase
VEYLAGDPTLIDFGLSGADYRRVLGVVRRVICAAEHPEGVRELERAAAVRVAGEVVEFIRAGGAPEGLTFLSSLLALGSPSRPVLEGELEVGQSFFSKYEESLAVAEKTVRGCGEHVPLMVLRSAPVSAREDSGELFDEAPLFRLARRIQVSTPMSEVAYRDEPVRFECVEPVAELLLRLADSAVPRTVHLADRVPLSDRTLVDFLLAHYHRDPAPRGMAVPFRMRLSLPDVVAAHSVLGWRSRFDLSEAERFCPDLLSRDPMQRLRKFFPSHSVDADQEGEVSVSGTSTPGVGHSGERQV